MVEHRPARSESLQPHTKRSSRLGPEPSSVKADVYAWCYALLLVDARKEEEEQKLNLIWEQDVHDPKSILGSLASSSVNFHCMLTRLLTYGQLSVTIQLAINIWLNHKLNIKMANVNNYALMPILHSITSLRLSFRLATTVIQCR